MIGVRIPVKAPNIALVFQLEEYRSTKPKIGVRIPAGVPKKGAFAPLFFYIYLIQRLTLATPLEDPATLSAAGIPSFQETKEPTA